MTLTHTQAFVKEKKREKKNDANWNGYVRQYDEKEKPQHMQQHSIDVSSMFSSIIGTLKMVQNIIQK